LCYRSPFREPYVPTSGDNHVIICGCISNKRKLEKFFKEFYHPDRIESSGHQEYHCVLFAPYEPSEEIRSLLISPMLDTKVTYVIGSVLNVADLKLVRVDTASAMFFLCETELHSTSAEAEDSAIILRALSVVNFNPNLNCFVQIVKQEDRATLKDSDVDVILCLNEFKTALLARNAVCPGFSTFVENIFHSFGNVSMELEKAMDPWYAEYLHGARMELYFVDLSQAFRDAVDNDFNRMAEGIYLEFQLIVLGVVNKTDHDVILNPGRKEKMKFASESAFFDKYSSLLIIADDQIQADSICSAIRNASIIQRILEKLEAAENTFCIRDKKSENVKVHNKKNFRFFARNVITPINKTLQVSKAAKIRKEKTEEETVHNSDSDDENEQEYIGFRGNLRDAINAALPREPSAKGAKFNSFPKAAVVNREIGGGSPSKSSKKDTAAGDSAAGRNNAADSEGDDRESARLEGGKNPQKRRSDPVKSAVDEDGVTSLGRLNSNIENSEENKTIFSPVKEKPGVLKGELKLNFCA
jgi:hypothetical protein